jgi:hypothetical protein
MRDIFALFQHAIAVIRIVKPKIGSDPTDYRVGSK